MSTADTGDTIRTRPAGSCILCGSPGREVYAGMTDRLFGIPGRWRYRKCADISCGLIWLDPAPVDEDLMRTYVDYYTHTNPLRRGPVFAVYRACFYTLNSLVVALSGQWSRSRALARMYIKDTAPGRLLDVGAGSGKFLYEMRGRGWEVEGLDADPQAAEAAGERYGMRVHACGLMEARFPSCSFDAITLNHVLEHLPDPVALLQECERILRPGGRLVCVTPNADSWGHRRFGQNWRGLEPPRHLYVFNPRSLAVCAEKAGFARFHLSTNAGNSWPMIYESLQLESSVAYTIGSGDRPKALALRALLLEFKECRLLKKAPDAGEVCVLLCDKPVSP